MVKALATRCTWGGSRIGVSIALGVLWPIGLLAQPGRPPTPPRAPAPAAKAASGSTKAAPVEDAEAGAEPAAEVVQEAPDIQRDERAEAVIKDVKKFKPIRSEPGPIPAQALIEKMAQGGVVDRNLLDTFTRYQASQMTSRRVLDGLASKKVADNEAALQMVQRSFESLMQPVILAQRANRKEFLQAYSQALLKVMPELLQNHLYARIEGMIVLSRIGDPGALRTFTEQINDPAQVAMVKLLAAHGVTNVVRNNKQGINPDAALGAARALNDFLNRETDAIWPAQYRALEALGWLRQPAVNPLAGKYEMVDTAMKFLADPKARPEVRSWAAWALGMMRVDPGAKINYTKAAHDLGQLAVELGDRILAINSPRTDDQAHDLIALLASPVYNALNGEPELQASGLVRSPALGKAEPFVKKLEPLVKAEAIAAVGLGRGPQGLHSQAHRELAGRVKALRDYLSQNPPRVAAGPGEGPVVEAVARPAGVTPRGR